MVIQTSYLTSQNFLTSNYKIPEYVREYKKEYLFIIGIDKEIRNFIDNHLTYNYDYLLKYHERIEKIIKRFMRGRELNYLKDISTFAFKCCDVLNLYRLDKKNSFWNIRLF